MLRCPRRRPSGTLHARTTPSRPLALLVALGILSVSAPAGAGAATLPSHCEPPTETGPYVPVCAQAETFGGQPADVLLTYAAAVSPAMAAQCVAVESSGAQEAFGGVEAGPTADSVRLQLAPAGAMPAAVQCPSEPAVGQASARPASPFDRRASSSERPASTSVRPASLSVSLASSSPAETSITVSAGPSTEGGVVSDPIDPKYLLDVPFGKTSFWLQPWRAYLDTRPGSQLLHAVGVNFDVSSSDAEAAAQLLQESGFVLARVEIDWSDLDYSNPQTLRSNNEASIRAHLTALHNHGLRPLIVLNSNSTAPAPLELVKLETTETAPKGANTVKLTAASAARVVPGKTGFNELTWTGSPDVLITSVEPGGVAKLSRPLPEPLSAGPHGGTTLLYAPFQAPTLRNGRSNPAFQATLAGWLSYVGTVCREAQAILGPGGFDLEIWNELTFGSQFLNGENYGPPAGNGSERAEHKAQVTKAVIRTLLGATVAYVRNPANGISPGVAITDGFASQTPFPSGAYAPLGLNALSKHPYVVGLDYPGAYRPSFIRPVNALGTQDLAPKSPPPFVPLFIPSFETLLPEFTLMGESTETLIRDIAPITTEIYGLPHGREVGPSGGPPLQKWITEYNLGVPHGSPELTPADEAHFHAKALLRSLVAMVSKGISREYFFAAAPGPFGLIGNEFFAALEAHPGTYPGQALGGEVMNAFRNLLAAFGGPGPSGSPRPLTLSSITQEGNHAQFSGDGTAAHPNLYDREVLAVFPYQTSPTEFVIPVYVMTSYLLTDYQPGAPTSDVHRFDLPDESFRITLGSLPEGASPTVSAYDPLLGAQTPARLVSRVGGTAVFEVAATDYPRLLRLSYSGAA